MRRKEGFTLVELLVVMAIIAILAAIAIPNVQKYIAKAKATRAIQEISSIELALTKVLSDAGRSSLNDLFDADLVKEQVNGTFPMGQWTADEFERAVQLYTNAVYVLLKKGREARPIGVVSTTDFGYILDKDAIKSLGLTYMSDLGNDPWGKLYNIVPGPWPRRGGLIVFRKYLPSPQSGVPGDDTDVADNLSIADGDVGGFVDEDLSDTGIGYPAEQRKEVYIWSNGANGISGQARYLNFENGGYAAGDIANNYEPDQEPELMGGGDDVNNWDKLASFMRHYN